MGTGPRQHLVPTRGPFGASLPQTPLVLCPPTMGNSHFHPQNHQPKSQGGLSSGTFSLEPQQTPCLHKAMGFIQTSLLIPALSAFFVAITSTMSQQHFPHLTQLNSISMPQIHPKLSLHHTNGPGGYCCRGWLEQHSPSLNTTVVAEELPKVPIPSLP